MAILLIPLTDRSLGRLLQPEKRLRVERFKLHSNLKNARVLAPPMLFNIELRRQCPPLTFRSLPASNGPRRTSDATYLYGFVAGCRISKIQAYEELDGMHPQQGVPFGDVYS